MDGTTPSAPWGAPRNVVPSAVVIATRRAARAGPGRLVEPRGVIKLHANEVPRIPGTWPEDPEAESAYTSGLQVKVVLQEGMV